MGPDGDRGTTADALVGLDGAAVVTVLLRRQAARSSTTAPSHLRPSRAIERRTQRAHPFGRLVIVVACPAVDPLGACSLFAGLSQLGATPTDDRVMLDIIHDGGGFKDGQVYDSQLEPGTYCE